MTTETTTNYLSPTHTALLFLPHLRALSARGTPTAVILVSSGLALVPIPRVPNYGATKAAIQDYLQKSIDNWHTVSDALEALLPEIDRSEPNDNYRDFLQVVFVSIKCKEGR